MLVRKIKIHGQITAAASGTNLASYEPYLPQKVRLMVVQDQQTNGAQMTAAQLMNDAGASDTTINSYQNPNNFGRFRVLKDKDILIQDPNFTTEYNPDDNPQTGYARTNGLIRTFKININLKVPIKVQFNAVNGGTVLILLTTPSTCSVLALECQPITLLASATTRVLLTRSNYDNKTQFPKLPKLRVMTTLLTQPFELL